MALLAGISPGKLQRRELGREGITRVDLCLNKKTFSFEQHIQIKPLVLCHDPVQLYLVDAVV
jgi:hypothetical protein